jgi:hypothetical protein
MKVYIGKYPQWIGPYQLAEKIPFISEDTREKVADYLHDSWVGKLCVWVDSKKKRKIKVRIDKYDTWNMDSTLSPIILPMLKQLKETKHGSPMVDEEDLPSTMRYEGENWVHHKWDWVLNEMIWAFEQLNDPDNEEQFYHGIPSYNEEEMEIENYGKCYSYKQTNPDYWVDYEAMKAHEARIANGCRLFGKYYRNLWD